MAIITDGINQHFRDARAGRPMEKTASSGQITVAPGRLPRVGLGNQVHGGNTAYGRYLGERTAAFQRHGEMTGASANVSQSSPAIRNPLLSITNFDLPYDRKTLNQWIRFYAKMDPFVGNIIELHGQFPISDFHFAGISDEGILQQYDEQKERCRMVQHAFESSQEYEKLGEAFTFWQWDDDDVCWNDYTIINPDRLEVQEVNWGSDMNAFYSLDPPDELKALTRDGNPEIQSMLERLDPAVLEALSGNRRVPLDPFNVMALIRKDAPYESRGTSPILRVLRTLMYKDKLIEAQYAIADQQITPVQLWKIGDPASNFMPSEADLEAFRALLQAGRHDPLFTIVSHAAVNLDLIGYTGKLLPIIPEMEWAAKQIMIGLFTNEATITGAGPTYGSAIVALKILQGRYQAKRDKMVDLYKKKLLKPFAEARGIFKTTKANVSHRVRTRRVPVIPDIEWNFKLDLTDSAQRLQYMMQLRDKLQLPARVLCDVLNLDYETVKKNLKDEEGTVFDPAYQDARKERAKASGGTGTAGGGAGLGGGGGAGGGGAPAAPGGDEAPATDATPPAAPDAGGP